MGQIPGGRTTVMKTDEVSVDNSIEHLVIASDLHGYREPLAAFERSFATASSGQRKLFFNGDMFEGGIDPSETTDWLRKNADGTTVRGNHDYLVLNPPLGSEYPCDSEAYACHELSPVQLEFVRGLPEQLIVHWRSRSICLTHGHLSPNGEEVSWLSTPDEMTDFFGDSGFALTVTAHTHWPFIRRNNGCLVANTGSLVHPIIAARMADGSLHWQTGRDPFAAGDDFRSSFLLVSEHAGELECQIVRFDYNRQALLDRYRQIEELRYTFEFRQTWLTHGIADLRKVYSS